MPSTATPGLNLDFLKGDEVTVLYQGRYNGMHGHFVMLRDDATWADIEEQDGAVRPYPVAWLRRRSNG